MTMIDDADYYGANNEKSNEDSSDEWSTFSGSLLRDVREGTYGTCAYVPGVGLRMMSD